MTETDKQTEFLFARLSDLRECAQRGIFSVSSFFSPGEIARINRWIASERASDVCRVFGGYAYAERARVYCLPDYMAGEDVTVDLRRVLSDFGEEDPTVILRIEGSGFRTLSHRDYMGSVLALGIERGTVGDILTDGDFCAYVFCDVHVASYICDNLKKVSSDSVKVSTVSLPDGDFGQRRYNTLHETVNSPRLDAIVACVCDLSREAAKRTVMSGMCELDYEPVDEPDLQLCEGSVFSVRGHGKYRIGSFDGENRRGRLRVTIHKFI